MVGKALEGMGESRHTYWSAFQQLGRPGEGAEVPIPRSAQENAGTPAGPDHRLQQRVLSREGMYRSFPCGLFFFLWIVGMSSCDCRMTPRANKSSPDIFSRVAVCTFASTIVGSPDHCFVARTGSRYIG